MEEFFSTAWQADKTSETPLLWHDTSVVSTWTQFSCRWKFAPSKMQTGSLFADENSEHFGTKIISSLIKNRLLFCRKCPSMKFVQRGMNLRAAQMWWIITEFTPFNGNNAEHRSFYGFFNRSVIYLYLVIMKRNIIISPIIMSLKEITKLKFTNLCCEISGKVIF